MVYIHCKEQPIYVVYGKKNRCLSPDPPKTHQYTKGQNAEVLGVTLGTKITYLCDLKTEK